MIEPRSRGVLDSPPEPVIGLAEGETRWRGMTPVGVVEASLLSIQGVGRESGDDALVPLICPTCQMAHGRVWLHAGH